MLWFKKKNKLVDAEQAREASQKGLEYVLVPLREEIASRIRLATSCGEYDTYYSVNAAMPLKYIEIVQNELEHMGYSCNLDEARILRISWCVQADVQETPSIDAIEEETTTNATL